MREIRIVAPGEATPSPAEGWELDIAQTLRDANAGHLFSTYTRHDPDAEQRFADAFKRDRKRADFADHTPKRGRGQPQIKLLTLPHLIRGLECLGRLEDLQLLDDLQTLRDPADAAWIEALAIGADDLESEADALAQPDRRVAQRQITPARAYSVARFLEHLRTLCGLVGDPQDGALDAAALFAYLVAPVLDDAEREWLQESRRLEQRASSAWSHAVREWDQEQPYQRLFAVWQHDAALLFHQRRRPAGGAVAWALEALMLAGALPSDLDTPPHLAPLDLLAPSLKRLERQDGALPFTAEEVADLPNRCSIEEINEETGKSPRTFATPQMVSRSAHRDTREPLRKTVDERLRLLREMITPQMEERLQRLRVALF
jgi:hypothetical protein